MRPITTTWLPATGNETALFSGDLVPDSTYFLKLNSNEYANGQPTGAYVFQSIPPMDSGNANVYRSLAFSSDQDLSGVNITIIGQGILVNRPTDTDLLDVEVPFNEITEVNQEGPNADLVTTGFYFSKVISIQVEVPAMAVPQLSIGWGKEGITSPIITDYDKMVYNSTAQMQVIANTLGPDFSYTVWKSASDFECPQVSAGDAPFYTNPLVMFPYTQTFLDANGTEFDSDSAPVTIVFAQITGNTNEQAVFTFIQQGIR
jgi:hypothetical protein